MLLYPIWLVLAAVFFTFAYQQWRLIDQEIRPFRLRTGAGTGSEEISEFVHDWNQYIDQMNANMKTRHRVSMAGFAIAGALSLISMFMTLPA